MRYLFLLLFIIFQSCNAVNQNHSVSLETMTALSKQGHRGCRGLMPENTIPAMLHAIDLGATTLEMDVVITKDRKVILSHEPFFNHEISTKPNGQYVTEEEEKSFNIYEMTYAQTQQFDVGMKPHPRFPQQQKLTAHKPLLDDLFKEVETYTAKKEIASVHYNIEIKSLNGSDNVFHPEPSDYTELLMDIIQKNSLQNRVVIQSFDPRPLQYLHEKYPAITTALLVEDYDKTSLNEQLVQLGFTPAIYSPAYQLVNKGLVQNCHDRNIKVIPLDSQ